MSERNTGSSMTCNCHRRVLSGDDNRVAVVVQDAFYSNPGSFQDFFGFQAATFVDKTLAIEAFLRNGLSHHLIPRPRRCGKSLTLSMVREFVERPRREPLSIRDITKGIFDGTLIAGEPYQDLVAKYYQQFPVLHIDLKDIRGSTFDEMTQQFDDKIRCQVLRRSDLFLDGIVGKCYIEWYHKVVGPELQNWRISALLMLSEALNIAYKQRVIVLIDEYDLPMHNAIAYGFADQASSFFATVFSLLLKENSAVCASMMVGICRTAKSGWLSELNNIEVFPMHAQDDRYSRFFLFTEKEVMLLCDAHKTHHLDLAMLREHYNGYSARGSSGPVKLFNPLSVIRALERDKVSNYWIETGRNTSLTQNLWRASPQFRVDFGLLMTQNSVKLELDEYTNFKTLDNISDAGLWGLMYYAGYITVHEFGGPCLTDCTYRIPNGEVTSEWHRWLKEHLKKVSPSSLLDLRKIITDGDALTFQTRFTFFLQENLSLFCAPRHQEKVYQALSFMLFFLLFDSPDRPYDVKMEQDDGHRRSDITAHPRTSDCPLSLIFEIKTITTHFKKHGKRMLKPAGTLRKELESATAAALRQIEDRQYRARAPLHATELHEYGLAFAGKFCVAAVRSFRRGSGADDWQEVSHSRIVIPNTIPDTVLGGDDSDGDMEVDEDV